MIGYTSFMKTHYSKLFFIFIPILIVGCVSLIGQKTSSQHSSLPQQTEISLYLTKQAESTPIPTGTPSPGQSITQTVEASEVEWVKMTASDPSKFQIASGKYQLVEIMAFWCLECRDLNPVLKGLEKEWGDKVNFVYLDVDDPLNTNHLQQLSQYSIVPEVILLDGQGKVVKDWIGPPSKEDLTTELNSLLQ